VYRHSSSRNAVRISSARRIKRFPYPFASTIQIVRPSRSTVATQPKLKRASWRLSKMICQYFTVVFLLIVQNRCGAVLLSSSCALTFWIYTAYSITLVLVSRSVSHRRDRPDRPRLMRRFVRNITSTLCGLACFWRCPSASHPARRQNRSRKRSTAQKSWAIGWAPWVT
jgi:hypothetical protein